MSLLHNICSLLYMGHNLETFEMHKKHDSWQQILLFLLLEFSVVTFALFNHQIYIKKKIGNKIIIKINVRKFW